MENVKNVFGLIPLFFGESIPNVSDDESAFVTCCRLAHDTLEDVEEKTLLLKIIPTKLRGRALELAHNKEFKKLEELITFIQDNFCEEKSYMSLNNELRMVRQYPGESLCSFLNRVKRLLAKCKVKAVEQYNAVNALNDELEELAVNSFKMGINNLNHKFFLFQDGEKTLELLTPKVKRMEQAEQCLLYPNFPSMYQNQSHFSNPYTNFPQDLHSANNIYPSQNANHSTVFANTSSSKTSPVKTADDIKYSTQQPLH